MKYAVEIYFDAPTEEVLRGVMEDLRTAGLPAPLLESDRRPHVTVMACQDVDDPVEDSLQSLAEGMPLKRVSLDSAGAFPGEEGVVFLGPVLDIDLLEFHHNVHELCDTLVAGRHKHYTPGSWVPHCTVAYGLAAEQVGHAVRICLRSLPLLGRLAEIGLRDVEDDETLYVFPFEGGE